MIPCWRKAHDPQFRRSRTCGEAEQGVRFPRREFAYTLEAFGAFATSVAIVTAALFWLVVLPVVGLLFCLGLIR